MSLSDQHVTELSRGAVYSFADWPNPSVPAFGAGVYTIWHNDGRFIYVGMSGFDAGCVMPLSRIAHVVGLFDHAKDLFL